MSLQQTLFAIVILCATLNVGVHCACDDSDSQCNANDTTVAVGDKFTARVQFKWNFYYVAFQLCNANNCSIIRVYGYDSNGGLNFKSYTGCNAQGADCQHADNSSESDHDWLPASGELIFGVERASGGLSVWLYGHPQKNAWIAAPEQEGYDKLRIRPYSDWDSDMPVELIAGDLNTCNDQEMQCSDGKCLSLIRKCDGAKDCSDGGDEDPATCNVPAIDLDEQHTTIFAKVHYKPEHGDINFLFCDITGCTKLTVSGCATPGSSWTMLLSMYCNSRGAFCYGGGGGWCTDAQSLPAGELVFKVELQRWSRVRLSLQGYPDRDEIVDERYRRQLRIIPGTWSSDMPVEFSVDPPSASL